MSRVDVVHEDPAGIAPPKRRQGSTKFLGVDVAVLWLIIPGVIPVMVLSVYPLLRGVYLGFTNSHAGFNQPTLFTGLDNYRQVLHDSYFWSSFRTGIIWAVSVTILQFLASLGLALLLNQRLPGRGALRTMAILPWAVPPVVVGFMWQLVYQPNAGLLNATLHRLGLMDSNVSWLTSGFALPAVVLAAVWAAMPITTVVILAALQSVPAELHEAAALDRAGPFSTFRVVTWPVILPSVVAITSLNFIANFNEFSLVYVMTNGSPSGALRLPMLLAYDEAFRYGNFGYAAALGNVMVLVLTLALVIYLRVTLRGRANA